MPPNQIAAALANRWTPIAILLQFVGQPKAYQLLSNNDSGHFDEVAVIGAFITWNAVLLCICLQGRAYAKYAKQDIMVDIKKLYTILCFFDSIAVLIYTLFWGMATSTVRSN